MSEYSFWYTLVGHVAVPVSMEEWVAWSMRQVKEHGGITSIVRQDHVGDVLVSTVFLGLNHAIGGELPQVFETMIFGGEHHDYQQRYATWGEADLEHRRALRLVRGETLENSEKRPQSGRQAEASDVLGDGRA